MPFAKKQVEFSFRLLLLDKNCSVKQLSIQVERVKQYMDENEDKCADFYAYACNGWIKSRTLPRYLVTYDSIDELKEIYTEKLTSLFFCLPLAYRSILDLSLSSGYLQNHFIFKTVFNLFVELIS